MKCTHCGNYVPEFLRVNYITGKKPCKWCKVYIDNTVNLEENNMVSHKDIAPELARRVREIPEAVRLVQGKRSLSKYASMATTLKAIGNDKALVYSKDEFLIAFGKNGKTTVSVMLRKCGIKRPKITIVGDEVWITYAEV